MIAAEGREPALPGYERRVNDVSALRVVDVDSNLYLVGLPRPLRGTVLPLKDRRNKQVSGAPSPRFRQSRVEWSEDISRLTSAEMGR